MGRKVAKKKTVGGKKQPRSKKAFKRVDRFERKIMGASDLEHGYVGASLLTQDEGQKFQHNVLVIEDKDNDLLLTIQDRQRTGKYNPNAKFIVMDDYEGQTRVREYDRNKQLLAELLVQVNQTGAINTGKKDFVVLSPQGFELLERFDQVQTQSASIIKKQFSLSELRVLGEAFDLKSSRKKDEKLDLIRQIRKKRRKLHES